MIQDIYPHKLNNQYDPEIKPAKEDFVISMSGSSFLIDTRAFEENVISFPKLSDIDNEKKFENEMIYLFSVDDERYFLSKEIFDETDRFKYSDARAIRKSIYGPQYRIFAAMTAKHLYDWYRDNRFCGRCGQEMMHSETERAMKCPKCNYTAYPRIMPAVIVGVTNGDRILLTKYKTGFAHNALVAGFTEIGETVEETVAREVMEEAGLKVKNIRYYKSQPWGIANDILMGFYCDVDGSEEIHMDETELKYAEWVKREDIILQPDNFSLTNEMMSMFKEGKDI